MLLREILSWRDEAQKPLRLLHFASIANELVEQSSDLVPRKFSLVALHEGVQFVLTFVGAGTLQAPLLGLSSFQLGSEGCSLHS